MQFPVGLNLIFFFIVMSEPKLLVSNTWQAPVDEQAFVIMKPVPVSEGQHWLMGQYQKRQKKYNTTHQATH